MAKLFIVDDETKCNGCNWGDCRLYALASSQKEANKLYKSGDAGLCAHCIVDLLIEDKREIQ